MTRGLPEHKWEKSNLVTITKGGRMYDTYRCVNCGATAKRYGFGWPPAIDDKFKKMHFCGDN